MIKKLLFVAIMALASVAWAQEKISLVWGFTPGSVLATNYRNLIAEANRIQTKYEFVFESRVGAAGAVAAHYVSQNANNSLLGATSTFFVRPYFNTESAYNLANYAPVLVQSQDAPLVLFSRHYHNLTDVPRDRQITVGISGVGGHPHLLASVLAETYGNIRMVNYNGLADAKKDVLGGHIDMSWGYLNEILPLWESGLVRILGITGSRSIGTFRPLSQQGMPRFGSLSNTMAVFASTRMDTDRLKEISLILSRANQQPELVAFYRREHAVPGAMTPEQTGRWYREQWTFWERMAAQVRPIE